MFHWDAERIRWYQRALEVGEYPWALRGAIEELLSVEQDRARGAGSSKGGDAKRPPEAPFVDALEVGAGTGAFTVLLAEYVGTLTALDPSAEALAALAQTAAARGLTNVRTRVGTLEDYPERGEDVRGANAGSPPAGDHPAGGHDLVAAAHVWAAGEPAGLAKMVRLSRRAGLLVVPVSPVKRDFGTVELLASLGRPPIVQACAADVGTLLDGLGVAHRAIEVESEFGQPFLDREEADRFIMTHFHLGPAEAEAVHRFLDDRLVERDGRPYLPNRKREAVIRWDRTD